MNNICEKCGQMKITRSEVINGKICFVEECGCGKKVSHYYVGIKKSLDEITGETE